MFCTPALLTKAVITGLGNFENSVLKFQIDCNEAKSKGKQIKCLWLVFCIIF